LAERTYESAASAEAAKLPATRAAEAIAKNERFMFVKPRGKGPRGGVERRVKGMP